jgi:hypothetical protein
VVEVWRASLLLLLFREFMCSSCLGCPLTALAEPTDGPELRCVGAEVACEVPEWEFVRGVIDAPLIEVRGE